jgi:hypothetical protein
MTESYFHHRIATLRKRSTQGPVRRSRSLAGFSRRRHRAGARAPAQAPSRRSGAAHGDRSRHAAGDTSSRRIRGRLSSRAPLRRTRSGQSQVRAPCSRRSPTSPTSPTSARHRPLRHDSREIDQEWRAPPPRPIRAEMGEAADNSCTGAILLIFKRVPASTSAVPGRRRRRRSRPRTRRRPDRRGRPPRSGSRAPGHPRRPLVGPSSAPRRSRRGPAWRAGVGRIAAARGLELRRAGFGPHPGRWSCHDRGTNHPDRHPGDGRFDDRCYRSAIARAQEVDLTTVFIATIVTLSEARARGPTQRRGSRSTTAPGG